jgi:uncharacterized coiled-coil protein SlyX
MRKETYNLRERITELEVRLAEAEGDLQSYYELIQKLLDVLDTSIGHAIEVEKMYNITGDAIVDEANEVFELASKYGFNPSTKEW